MGLPKSLLWKRLLPIVLVSLVCATGGCKPGSWSLWNAYSSRFIDAQGRVFDPKGDQHTTSEGQAYALFFSLADNDQSRFDRILTWTQTNLAGGDLQTHLPAWLWGKDPSGVWKLLDTNSASDADVWMAYTLIEAGRLWKSPQYTNLGRKMLAQIAATEVEDLPGFGPMLLPGSVGFKQDRTWTLNPSYLPVFIFERLATVDSAGPWRQIAANTPRLIRESVRHGYAMDWLTYLPGDGFYPMKLQKPGGNDNDGIGGGYDAIRVYLWAGMMNPKGKARAAMVNTLSGMCAYLADHDAPPEKISDLGVPLAQDGPVGFSAALLPYLRAFPDRSKLSTQQMIRMNLMKDESTGLYGKDLAYYDQNLALFATGFLDGRFTFGPEGELKVEWTRR
jgi:endo-1,4-beta-D-glucanase Y